MVTNNDANLDAVERAENFISRLNNQVAEGTPPSYGDIEQAYCLLTNAYPDMKIILIGETETDQYLFAAKHTEEEITPALEAAIQSTKEILEKKAKVE